MAEVRRELDSRSDLTRDRRASWQDKPVSCAVSVSASTRHFLASVQPFSVSSCRHELRRGYEEGARVEVEEVFFLLLILRRLGKRFMGLNHLGQGRVIVRVSVNVIVDGSAAHPYHGSVRVSMRVSVWLPHVIVPPSSSAGRSSGRSHSPVHSPLSG
jgi:hypothetical protein